MEGKSVSDADLLNIIQGFNKAEVNSENIPIDIGIEKKEQSNEESDNMSKNLSKETLAKGVSCKENLESGTMKRPEKLEDLTKKAEVSVTQENINENVDELFTSEGHINKFEMSGSPDDVGDTTDMSASLEFLNENSFHCLSHFENEAELDKFIDCNTDEGKVNSQMAEALISNVEPVQLRTNKVKKIPKSQLHCAICNNYFERPKLLECLHTFCQSCLMKKTKNNHKFIFCMICSQRSNRPKGGIDKLADNVVAASLVERKLKREKLEECMICKLHNEINTATAQCLDCGDIMCQNCSKNHTFSRITAKHVVVTLEEAYSGPYGKSLQKESVTHCMKHSDGMGEYFCLVCCVPVCNECKQSDHRKHKCDILKDAVAGKREQLKDKLDTFKLDCAKKFVDDTDESRSLISEHKEKEFKKLAGARDSLVSIIDKKYTKCLKQIQEEYDIKMRKYGKRKNLLLNHLSKDIDSIEQFLQFLLSEGNDLKAAMLENIFLTSIGEQRMQLGKLPPKLTEESSFPNVKIFKKHTELAETMTFFCTNKVFSEQTCKDGSENVARSEKHFDSRDVRMRSQRLLKNEK